MRRREINLGLFSSFEGSVEMGSKYRSRLEIIADILSVVRGGAKKTEIMYQANLSYKLLIQYLKDVLEANLVTHASENSFMLTEKGLDFLTQFNSYHERRQELEEQLRGVHGEKVTLENRFLDSETVSSDLRMYPSRNREINKKKKAAE